MTGRVVQLPQTPGGFGTIIADPAWSFRDKGSRISPDRKVKPIYRTKPEDWIAALPVGEVAAPTSHLYLWVPSALLPQGLWVMHCWGFNFKTTLIWDKITKTGKEFFGAGHYFRASHEVVLFGTRGRCPARAHNRRSRFTAVVGKHSEKPDYVHWTAEALSPGPYLELFARRHRPGWTCWGDQLPALTEAA